jgi:DNA-binding Lrp family transcriptional regulator
MAETAFLLISLDRSTPAAVAREVRKIDGVVEAHVTMGEFDVVVRVERETTKGFPAVASAIQRIEGVTKVSTCAVVLSAEGGV